MTYEDATDSWAIGGETGGVYFIRSQAEGREDVVRIGAGGGSGGSLSDRLGIHTKKHLGPKSNQTYLHRPYAVIRAWRLKDWTGPQIYSAEHCLYRAFAIRLPAFDKDRSHFIVPASYDFSDICADFEADLRTMMNTFGSLSKANV